MTASADAVLDLQRPQAMRFRPLVIGLLRVQHRQLELDIGFAARIIRLASERKEAVEVTVRRDVVGLFDHRDVRQKRHRADQQARIFGILGERQRAAECIDPIVVHPARPA
jgi:hypothetical protein